MVGSLPLSPLEELLLHEVKQREDTDTGSGLKDPLVRVLLAHVESEKKKLG